MVCRGRARGGALLLLWEVWRRQLRSQSHALEASAKPVSTGRHNTKPTLHSPRPEYSAWCEDGLSGSLFSFCKYCLLGVHTGRMLPYCGRVSLAASRTEPCASACPSFASLMMRLYLQSCNHMLASALREYAHSLTQPSWCSCYRDRHNGWHHGEPPRFPGGQLLIAPHRHAPLSVTLGCDASHLLS